MIRRPDLEGYLTVEDLSFMLYYSTRNIYKMASKGRLPKGIKIGGKRYWTKEEVNAYLEKTKAY